MLLVRHSRRVSNACNDLSITCRLLLVDIIFEGRQAMAIWIGAAFTGGCYGWLRVWLVRYFIAWMGTDPSGAIAAGLMLERRG